MSLLKLISLVIVLNATEVFAKTSVQQQSIELKAISATHSLIQICSEFECETVGSSAGYSKSEIQEMFVMNAALVKKLKYEKWFVSIGATILGSYFYKFGKIVVSLGVSALTFPHYKTSDEKIQMQEALQQRPQLLADGSYQLTPEVFSLVKEALIVAVGNMENCLRLNETYYGIRGFDYCQTGKIPYAGNLSIFYGYP